jgi:hypothetical protein
MLYSLTCPDVLDLLAAAETVLWATGYQADDCPEAGSADHDCADCEGGRP